MKRPVFLLFPVLAVALACAQPFAANAATATVMFWENVSISIDCTNSQVAVMSMVNSVNASLVHFPSEVDMNNPNLENVTMLLLTFANDTSKLMVQLNNTQGSNARAIADMETPTLNTAFQTTFTWASTVESGGIANVTYNGAGKQNLTQFTGYLSAHCLSSGLEGFSLTFLPFSHESDALIVVGAAKNSGGFEWAYQTAITYTTSIAAGSGSHFVDVLGLLKLESVAPSLYAIYGGYYQSSITLTVASKTSGSFVSCQPARVYQTTQRGWFIYPPNPPLRVIGVFSFGNSASSVNVLTFTFNATVIPEFPQMFPTAFLLLTIVALLLGKRIQSRHEQN
jgi:hypothetical protein